jgi:hypothetical protein
MSDAKSTTIGFTEQVVSLRNEDAENWTPEQAAEYAAWLKKVKNKHIRNQKNAHRKAAGRRTNDVINLEADIIAGLRNACAYAEMAELHAKVFDEAGFLYDLEEFINHAKLISDYIRNYRNLLEL